VIQFLRTSLCFAIFTAPLFAQAESTVGGFTLSGSGFATVGAGHIVSGTPAFISGKRCPCFVPDFAQEDVYHSGAGYLQIAPSTKLGLQGTVTHAESRVALTSQFVLRDVDQPHITLELLFASYPVNDSLTLHVGRKRIPMFYYSDVQDVGFALPWTHLPPQLYGWEAVNYNGISVQHNTQLGDWDVSSNLFAGKEQVSNSGYWAIYNGEVSKTNVQWDHILGGNVTLHQDWFEARIAYIQSDTSRVARNGVINPTTQTLQAASNPFLLGQITQQRIYTSALNFDFESWVVLGELLYISRPGATFNDFADRLALTHRIDNWEISAGISEYIGKSNNALGGDPQGQESHLNRAMTVRYFLSANSDLKLQLDAQRDLSGTNWQPKFGNVTLLSVAYDKVF
jgi:hypothetical protein